MKSLKYNKICTDLLADLKEREKAILSRRFALGQKEKETLESIGEDFDICRERVRQIEKVALKKVGEKSKKYKKVFTDFTNYLKKYGGVRKEEELLKDLGNEHENELIFLLTFKDEFKRKKEDKDFYASWVLNNDSYSEARETIKEAIKLLKKREELVKFSNLKGLTPKNERSLNSNL